MSKEEKKVISSVYKVNLHCPKCAHDIKEPLLRTPGVHSVDVKYEKNEITVKGIIDEKKIHKRIEHLSRKKVEILPPPAPPKVVEEIIEKETVVKETKSQTSIPKGEYSYKSSPKRTWRAQSVSIRINARVFKTDSNKQIKNISTHVKERVTVETIKIKAFMHCKKCEHDLRMRLLKKKGIHNVHTDMKAQTIVIEGTVDSKKILAYMKRVQKHAEIVPPPPPPPPKEDKKEKEKVEVKVKTTTETTKIVEVTKDKKVAGKGPDENVPYFVHYCYAPQLFSDENPNACSVM